MRFQYLKTKSKIAGEETFQPSMQKKICFKEQVLCLSLSKLVHKHFSTDRRTMHIRRSFCRGPSHTHTHTHTHIFREVIQAYHFLFPLHLSVFLSPCPTSAEHSSMTPNEFTPLVPMFTWALEKPGTMDGPTCPAYWSSDKKKHDTIQQRPDLI